SFQDPPPIDITKAPLPKLTVTLAATSSASLLRAHNLAQVLRRLTAAIGRHDLFIQLAISPGELEAVVAGSGGEAHLVTASYPGQLKAGPAGPVTGPRGAISRWADVSRV